MSDLDLNRVTPAGFRTPSDEAKAGDGLAAWCIALSALALFALGAIVWRVVR